MALNSEFLSCIILAQLSEFNVEEAGNKLETVYAAVSPDSYITTHKGCIDTLMYCTSIHQGKDPPQSNGIDAKYKRDVVHAKTCLYFEICVSHLSTSA